MLRRTDEGQKTLGKAIRSLREQMGLTQDQLGRRSEIHRSQIIRIEKGQVDPTYADVVRIAQGLGVSLPRLALEEARIEGRLGKPPRLGDPSAVDVGVRFGQNVRRLRQDAGLSQRRLAQRCAISLRTVGFIERGLSLPRLDTVVKLTASLGTSPEVLFDGLPAWLPDEGGAGRFSMPDLGEAT